MAMTTAGRCMALHCDDENNMHLREVAPFSSPNVTTKRNFIFAMSRKRLSSTYECLRLYDQYGKGRNEGVQIYLLVLAKWQTQLMFGQNKGQDDGHFINQEMHRRDSSWMLLLLCVQPAMQEGTFNQNSHMPQCSSRADARKQILNRLHICISFHTSYPQHRSLQKLSKGLHEGYSARRYRRALTQAPNITMPAAEKFHRPQLSHFLESTMLKPEK